MIALVDVYHVVAATVPLYVIMILAFISIKWWKLFSPEQCSGINKFVAKFSVPLLSFHVLSGSNLYKVNLKLLLADLIQKLLALFLLSVFAKLKPNGKLTWVITGLSVSTFPNTLIVGIPIMKGIFGDVATDLLAQIITLQSLVWYNLLLFLLEVNATKESYAASPSEVTVELEVPRESKMEEGVEEEAKARSPSEVTVEVEVPRESEMEAGVEEAAKTRSPRKTKIMLILLKVGRKLIINPNTHATLAGIIWSCIHFKFGTNLPGIVGRSISLLADGGLGMAMFSIGVFMASQTSIIPCGMKKAIFSMALRFVLGPLLMAISSIAVGLRGKLLKIAIIQAALPLGIVPFVFAKEYNIHPTILSTGVILGMLIAIPIALGYYLLLNI